MAEEQLRSAVGKGIAQFDSAQLKHINVQEKQSLPSNEAVAMEKKEEAFRSSIQQFSKENLRPKAPGEKIQLPDAQAISQEKTLQTIEHFDKTQLKPAQTTSSPGVPFLVSSEKTIEGISKFDKSNLKHTELHEKQCLPNTEAITQEKTEEALRSSIEQFPKDQLRHSYTQEKNRLPDKTAISQEKTIQNIEGFDRTQLHPTQTAESGGRVLAAHESAVKEIASFPKDKLKPTETKEETGLPSPDVISQEKQQILFQQSIKSFDKGQLKAKDGSDTGVSPVMGEALKGIAEFDKTQLKHTSTVESPDGIFYASQQETMGRISGFDKSSLKHAETAEKQALPDPDAIKMEKKEVEFRKSIEAFPKDNLRTSSTVEKNVLPDKTIISHEKTLQGIEGFNKTNLQHVGTAEPSATAFAVQETAMKGIADFDKQKLLRHTATDEKAKLPSPEEIQLEKKENEFRHSIEAFAKDNLRHSQTLEKVKLPDAAEIGQEKTLQIIEDFDKSKLKHTQTAEPVGIALASHEVTAGKIAGFDKSKLKPTQITEKSVMPDQSEINQEKTIQGIEGFNKGALKHATTTVKSGVPSKEEIAEEKKSVP